MINIRVEVVNTTKDRKAAEIQCEGHIKGNGADLRHEMIGVLQSLDKVAGGAPLRDALTEFFADKVMSKMAGAKDDDSENDDNA